MQSAIRLQATVLPGHRVEVTAPELPEGATVEVIVILPESPRSTRVSDPARSARVSDPADSAPRPSMLEFLATLPPGPRSYPTWEELDRRFQEERDAWDR